MRAILFLMTMTDIHSLDSTIASYSQWKNPFNHLTVSNGPQCRCCLYLFNIEIDAEKGVNWSKIFTEINEADMEGCRVQSRPGCPGDSKVHVMFKWTQKISILRLKPSKWIPSNIKAEHFSSIYEIHSNNYKFTEWTENIYPQWTQFTYKH